MTRTQAFRIFDGKQWVIQCETTRDCGGNYVSEQQLTGLSDHMEAQLRVQNFVIIERSRFEIHHELALQYEKMIDLKWRSPLQLIQCGILILCNFF